MDFFIVEQKTDDDNVYTVSQCREMYAQHKFSMCTDRIKMSLLLHTGMETSGSFKRHLENKT